MELGYAFFILLLYVVLVLVGIWLYEYWDRQREFKQPVQLPILTDKEKRRELNGLMAPLGFAYDGRQDIFYSRTDSWQRKYGYGRIYDEAAPSLNMIIDCEPIYFEYDEKKWMIEFWKGQYGITTGGEVGIYYLPRRTLAEEALTPELVYRCVEDEDTLRIQWVLWKKGRRLYERRGYHWWLTGFVLGEFSKPCELEMDIELTLKDTEMRDAFLKGLKEAGYGNGEIKTQGTTVRIQFGKPHSRQPLTRARWFAAVKQMENKRNCKLYHKATRDYTNAYDKLMALQKRNPGLYRRLEYLAKARLLYGSGADDEL